jgi:hypothetical protein
VSAELPYNAEILKRVRRFGRPRPRPLRFVDQINLQLLPVPVSDGWPCHAMPASTAPHITIVQACRKLRQARHLTEVSTATLHTAATPGTPDHQLMIQTGMSRQRPPSTSSTWCATRRMAGRHRPPPDRARSRRARALSVGPPCRNPAPLQHRSACAYSPARLNSTAQSRRLEIPLHRHPLQQVVVSLIVTVLTCVEWTVELIC